MKMKPKAKEKAVEADRTLEEKILATCERLRAWSQRDDDPALDAAADLAFDAYLRERRKRNTP